MNNNLRKDFIYEKSNKNRTRFSFNIIDLFLFCIEIFILIYYNILVFGDVMVSTLHLKHE